AEDGIRSFHVSGVQTCALPIFIPAVLAAFAVDAPFDVDGPPDGAAPLIGAVDGRGMARANVNAAPNHESARRRAAASSRRPRRRTEERRVGYGRAARGGGADHE